MPKRKRETQLRVNTDIISYNRKKLSVIINVGDKIDNVEALLKSVAKLQPKEIIVIESGIENGAAALCLAHSAKCISYPFPLGRDVARSIGAEEATGKVLLFLEGDIILKKKDLLPFVTACYDNIDIALHNDNLSFVDQPPSDHASIMKAFFNEVMQMPHLGFSSLSTCPHAMKKHAAKRIGYENLAIPPKALSIAFLKGLNVRQVHHVEVLGEKMRLDLNENRLFQQKIIGDHMEAIYCAQKEKGNRLNF